MFSSKYVKKYVSYKSIHFMAWWLGLALGLLLISLKVIGFDTWIDL